MRTRVLIGLGRDRRLTSGLPPSGLPWYCRSCWLDGRYAYNDPPPGSALTSKSLENKVLCVCKECGVAAAEVGWGHWVPEVQVPRALVKAWDRRRNSPPWLRVLRLRWPRAALVDVANY